MNVRQKLVLIYLLHLFTLIDGQATYAVSLVINATEGDDVNLPCDTTVRSLVWWKYHRYVKDTKLPTYIWMGENMVKSYRERAQFDNKTCSLTIHNVTVNDTGLYSCVDNDGFGETHSTWLTVGERNDSEWISHTPGPEGTSRVLFATVVFASVAGAVAVVIIVIILVHQRRRGIVSRNIELANMLPDMHARDVKQCIVSQFKELEEFIEPDDKLVDEMYASDIVTNREYRLLREKTDKSERSETLFHLLKKKDNEKCSDFLSALKKTDQQHVVNYIGLQRQRGEVEVGDDVPLDTDQLNRIRVNTPGLVQLLRCDDRFLERLAANKCITESQKAKLFAEKDAEQRNRKLLDTMKRRSVGHFKCFIDSLAVSGQSNLIAPLRENGVFIRTVATLDQTSVRDVSETENEVVECWRTITSAGDIEKRNKVLALLREVAYGDQNAFLALRTESSIGAFFFCRTRGSLEHLRQLYCDGQLKHKLESIFLALLKDKEKVCIKTLTWDEPCTENMETLSDPPITGKDAQETLLMIFFMAIFVHHLRKDGYVSEAGRLAYITLSSVCSDWWQVLQGRPQSGTRHRVKQRVGDALLPYCRRPKLATVARLDNYKSIQGLTQLDDKIYILCRGVNTVDVYDLNYKQMDGITVKDLKISKDIAACSKSNFLFIADCPMSRNQPGSVWKVSPDGKQVEQFLPTPELINFRPESMSLTSGRLLVTTDDNKLLLYGTEKGDALKTLEFPNMQLRHAVETSRGTFVICHMKPAVIEVNGEGQTICAYEEQHQLARPYYMSLDPRGNIFVADSRRRHVLLLTSDLRLHRVLLTGERDQLKGEPWRLLYIQHTCQLLVGSFADHFQVFTIGCQQSADDRHRSVET